MLSLRERIVGPTLDASSKRKHVLVQPVSVSVPNHNLLLWPVLRALQTMGGVANIQEMLDRVVEIMALTEAQQMVLHSDGRQSMLSYRLHWARTYLKAAGAMENAQRGIWSITDYGKTLTEVDMPHVLAQARMELAARKTQNKENSGALTASDAQLDRSLASSADAEAVSNLTTVESTAAELLASTDPERWHGYLLDVLKTMPPDAFERLCQHLLRESGFVKVQVIGKSGDGGIDGIGVLQMALLSFQVFFQCKRYQGSVGASAIRDFRGAMIGRTHKVY